MLPGSAMQKRIDRLISSLDLTVCDSVDLPRRRASRRPVPAELSKKTTARVLAQLVPDGKLWKHQALALQRLIAGNNVVVSTGTASGKSLVFQLYAMHRLRTDRDSKVLVFYPQRALASDQMSSWERVAKSAGFPKKAVGRIDGSITSYKEREGIIERARVVLMTPDVCQAWFMSTIGRQPNQRFLKALTLLVIDEAHVYESVLGSNAAFLIRRLLAAKQQISAQEQTRFPFQTIAATATIADAGEHLHQLTGLKFKVIDERQNGSPKPPQRILHVEGPAQGQSGESVIASIAAKICGQKTRHRFIAFMDSRQGVERIAQSVGKDNVKPYRSGYEGQDRAAIEKALQDGSLHGVVATSALELGIDIADMEIGINLGVPQSRKSFRQRLGRIGRSSPGLFLVVAPRNAFVRFGERLSDYYEGSLEPSHLYLGNRFVQFMHARCLWDEMEALGNDSGRAPGGAKWPKEFRKTLKFARGGRPPEFDTIARIGGDSPHYNYPLRQLGERALKIRNGQWKLGEITPQQAIRETYPGATYLHSGGRYKVHGWEYGFNEAVINVSRGRTHADTKPILRKKVTVDLSREGIVDRRSKEGKRGLFAEVKVQINESVEGYRVAGAQHLYRDLRGDDANMARKQRDFRTTGVLIQIEEEWFKEPSARAEVAEGLRSLLLRDRSIAPHDVDAAHANIDVLGESGPRRMTKAVVIYDSVHGGLRLTEDLFTDFDRYVDRLEQATKIAGADAIVSSRATNRLRDWARTLSEADPGAVAPKVDGPQGWLQIYKPGSVVGILSSGSIVESKIIKPVYRDPFDTGPQLYYECRQSKGTVTYVAHDQVQSIGQDEEALWNPKTGRYRKLRDTE